ncbi:MAG: hypothetical protein Q7J60_00020 [Bradyrhizobium sp.]|nr:hypothetical protein [Bradyrhizobium sp.]
MLFLFDGFLIQTGIKMLLIFVNLIYGKIDPAISIGVTFSLLAGGFLFSIWKTRSVLAHQPARADAAGAAPLREFVDK